MLRALVVLLLAANLLFFAFDRGWLDGFAGVAARSEREPQRMTQQQTPDAVALLAPQAALVPVVAGASLLALALLGALAAQAGGADMAKGALRVTLWGALAMGVTAGVGALVGQAV